MPRDIFDILAGQHEETRKLVAALADIPPQKATQRRRMGQRLARELISLDETEAQVLYRRLETFDDELRVAEGRHRDEQNRVDDAVWRLLNMNPDDPDWRGRLAELARELDGHIANEVKERFPKAREVLDKGEAKAMVETYIPLQDRRKHQIQH